jgi:bifunctional DNA-binding transcriptional regulator/antitoxin component of YhaV-PrlF toxin-antitoxin module
MKENKGREIGMPSLMTRKVIRFGTQGLAMTIPVAWARYHGLKAGDRLEVIAGGRLVIRPPKKE